MLQWPFDRYELRERSLQLCGEKAPDSSDGLRGDVVSLQEAL